MSINLTQPTIGSTNWGDAVNNNWQELLDALNSGSKTIGPVNFENKAGNYLRLPSLTTVQRDALTAVAGMLIYNSTTSQIERYQGSAWDGVASVGATAGGDLTGTYPNPTLAAAAISGKTSLTYPDSGDELLIRDSSASSLKRITTQAVRPYVCLRDEKTANTNGGDFTSGAWRTRVLNTKAADAAGICTLSSNQFTLQAGTYVITASAPAFDVNRHKTKLRNVTDGSDTLIGTSEWSYGPGSGATSQTRSLITGQFEIASAKAFEIQHRCETTKNIYGFGIASNWDSLVEVYTVVDLWKVA